MNLGTAEIIRANSRHLPLADNSVDLVVTSPPYFALRSYQDGGEHYAGQIGDEPTPAEFVASLLEVTAECVRVLKPSGSIFVNLGDKYVADNRGSGIDVKRGDAKHAPRGPAGFIKGGMRQKSLMGIPWRYALACIDDLGLILRAEVIWSKPNGLPESVTDRVRRSHEQWFHFTLEPRYFSAVDEIRQPYEAKPQRRFSPRSADKTPRQSGQSQRTTHIQMYDEPSAGDNPLGKLPGSVWTVPTEPLRVPDHLGIDHFAAFPTAWPRKIISAWCPVTTWETAPHSGICAGCGMPSDWADSCSQGCEPRPGIVLDPFGGTGTTALVAKALGRRGISVDMSADYCRLAEWRTNDRDQLAKVLGVAKADQQPEEQLSMLDLIDGGAA